MSAAYAIEHASNLRPKGSSEAADGTEMALSALEPRSKAPAPVEDHSELRSRVQSIEIGSRLTLAAAAAGLAYAVATWGGQHGMAVVSLLLAGAAGAIVPLVAGSVRIVHSPRREPLLLAWS